MVEGTLVLVCTFHAWRYIGVYGCHSDAHGGFQCCLLHLLLDWKQVGLHIDGRCGGGAEHAGDDLSRTPLYLPNGSRHVAASASAAFTWHMPRRISVEHLRHNHGSVYLSQSSILGMAALLKTTRLIDPARVRTMQASSCFNMIYMRVLINLCFLRQTPSIMSTVITLRQHLSDAIDSPSLEL